MDRKCKVLVVEDDEAILVAVGEYLKALKFEVESAGDGNEALMMLELFEPDVIMLDLRMPGMDGIEFMNAYSGPIPIVVMSGWVDTVREKLPREPFAKIMKPAKMSEVAPILRDAAASRVA